MEKQNVPPFYRGHCTVETAAQKAVKSGEEKEKQEVLERKEKKSGKEKIEVLPAQEKQKGVTSTPTGGIQKENGIKDRIP